MLSEIFMQIKDQWVRAKYQKKHPFRNLVLSTVTEKGIPKSRTVVLRDFDPQRMVLTVYTDRRSQKINELRAQKEASLLFYDPKKLWQIQVAVQLEKQSGDAKPFYLMPPPAQKDYTTALPPGSEITNPDAVHYNGEQHFFVALQFKIYCIESLKLKRPNHVRSRFDLDNGWSGCYLTP